jgi:transposase-like protein
MKHPAPRDRTISIAQRGQIVQRVIVEGWTSADVARCFGVPKPVVDVWVSDFRRYGMASLRQNTGRTAAVEMVYLTVSRPLRTIFRKIWLRLRPVGAGHVANPLPQPLPLRRSNEDGSG